MFHLRSRTGPEWTEVVLGDFDAFLRDHASCERKALATAMSLVGHYPDKVELVDAMLEVALEELDHFRCVWEIMRERGCKLASDVKDPYVAGLRTQLRRGKDTYFLDRLLTSAIIEARSCERLGLVAEALQPGKLKDFYRELTQCEARHHALFVGLGERYHARELVSQRLDGLLDFEAEMLAALPVRVAVH
ncbi:MAG: tRNA-(ms[2]io[6]A)-hydroxylase [Planctomycetes bacterium]|nr:tRNA-(ms[2]io[6]A)-hydroxylase [Planctomycetota bacterium]MDP6425023.1 tRNA-(ms[2]io[6]A)-hydroxylase [Planctomycetota bacterium]MDP7340594.1 tRNA-(ms[2]io[6]A)-hydroxylase [Vicinamibacterales bacterium]